MSNFYILINQSGRPEGTFGDSRSDLSIGEPVELDVVFSSIFNISSVKWEFLSKPIESAASITNADQVVTSGSRPAQATFTPDVIGSYNIKLTVNNIASKTAIAAVRTTSNITLRLPVAKEGEEFTRGWSGNLNDIIRALDGAAGGLVSQGIAWNTPWFEWNETDLTQFKSELAGGGTAEVVTINGLKWIEITQGENDFSFLLVDDAQTPPPSGDYFITADFLSKDVFGIRAVWATLLRYNSSDKSGYIYAVKERPPPFAPTHMEPTFLKLDGSDDINDASPITFLYGDEEVGRTTFGIEGSSVMYTKNRANVMVPDESGSPYTLAGTAGVGAAKLPERIADPITSWTWTNLSLSPSPEGYDSGIGRAFVWDREDAEGVLFGGYNAFISERSDDTWVWKNGAWTLQVLGLAPAPRSDHSMTYNNDAFPRQILLFGGTPDGTTTKYNDLWKYTGTWVEKIANGAVGSPSKRTGATFVWDEGLASGMLFGGSSELSGDLNDTWLLRYTANGDLYTWTQLSPSVSPSKRTGAIACYDRHLGKILMYGGTNNSTEINDMWEFDIGTGEWFEITLAADNNLKFIDHSLIYVPDRKRCVAFGGDTGDFGDKIQMWEFDYSTSSWIQQNASAGRPTYTSGVAAMYDETAKSVIIVINDTIVAPRTWEVTTIPFNTDIETFWFPVRSAMTAATTPPAREWNAIAYRPTDGYAVLFGGSDGTRMNDTWELDTNTYKWTEMSPSTPPSARQKSIMVWDPLNERMLLFGGYDGSNLNEMWEYISGEWAQVTTNTPPDASAVWRRMAVDSVRNKIVIFGRDVNEFSPNQGGSETWEFDLATDTWDEITPATTRPTARYDSGLAYDASYGKVIMYGGIAFEPDDDPVKFGDTISECWSWDGSDWELEFSEVDNIKIRMNDGPCQALYYSPLRESVIGIWYEDQSNFAETEIAEINLTDKRWDRIPNTGYRGIFDVHSPWQSRFEWTFDTVNNSIIVFGGHYAPGTSDATWITKWLPDKDGYTHDDPQFIWTNATDIVASSPTKRWRASMAYDPVREESIFFGGSSSWSIWAFSVFNETWSFKDGQWTQLFPATSPAKRGAAPMVWDSLNSRLLMFGGIDTVTYYNDLWEWNGTTWALVTTSGTPPSERWGSRAAVDPVRNKMFLFGGRNSNPSTMNDLWELDLLTNTWTELIADGVGGSPPAQFGAPMAYEPTLDKVLITQGEGAFSDTYHWSYLYDADLGTWTQITDTPRNSDSAQYNYGSGALHYSNQYERLVLISGYSAAGDSGKEDVHVHSFDPVTQEWFWEFTSGGLNGFHDIPGIIGPASAESPAWAFDEKNQTYVFFGGNINDNTVVSDETWTMRIPPLSVVRVRNIRCWSPGDNPFMWI